MRQAKHACQLRLETDDIPRIIYILFQDIMVPAMQVSKWGNSLAVRLPKALVEELGLKEGDELEVVSARAGTIEVETREEQRRRALASMRARQWALPPDYKFDRDEANER
jgi:antitoxin MazE